MHLVVGAIVSVKGRERDNGEGLPQADREARVAYLASGPVDSIEWTEQQTDRLVEVTVEGEPREVEADQA